jgi:septin family protein
LLPNAVLLSPSWSAYSSSSSPHPNTSQVAGESGLGKTTFINTLFSTTIKNYADHKRRHAKQVDKTVEIEITKAELEEKFFKGTDQTTNHSTILLP